MPQQNPKTRLTRALNDSRVAAVVVVVAVVVAVVAAVVAAVVVVVAGASACCERVESRTMSRTTL